MSILKMTSAALGAAVVAATLMSPTQAVAANAPLQVESHAVTLAAEPSQLVFVLNGTDFWGLVYVPEAKTFFNGYFDSGEYASVPFKYDNSVIPLTPSYVAVQKLSDLIAGYSQTQELIMLLCFSKGCDKVNDLDVARHDGKQPQPTVQELRIRVGDPYNGLTGMLRDNAEATSHPTVQVARMGDIVAVFPDRLFSRGGLMYLSEALSGLAWYHRMGYVDFDITSDQNLSYQDGDTTYILKGFDGKLRTTEWLRPFIGDEKLAQLNAERIAEMMKAFDNLDLYQPQTGSEEDVNQNARSMSMAVDDSPSAVPESVSAQFTLDNSVQQEPPQETQTPIQQEEEQVEEVEQAEEVVIDEDEQETDSTVKETPVVEEESTQDKEEAKQEAEAESDANEKNESAKEQSSKETRVSSKPKLSKKSDDSESKDSTNESNDNSDSGKDAA